jgi:uncharacterized protein (UPF0218 family)
VQDTLARLPDDVREDLREPLGPIYTDVHALLADAGEPILAVGDVVTHHLVESGHPPAVALVDGRTKREATTGAVADTLADRSPDAVVPNEAGTVSAQLLDALADALAASESTLVAVEGEEDLAVLPAVLLAPLGATVVYGQPDEGMVRVPVDEATRATVRDLLRRFDADDRLWARL